MISFCCTTTCACGGGWRGGGRGGGGVDGRGGGERWGGVNVKRGRGSEDVRIVQIIFHLGTCGKIGTIGICFIPLGFSWIEALIPSSILTPCTFQENLNYYLPTKDLIDYTLMYSLIH